MSKVMDTERTDLRAMLTLRCPHATRLISESMDRPLTRRERFGLRMHLLTCRPCARFKKQWHSLRALFSRSFEVETEDPTNATPPMPVGLSNQARDRIKSALSQAS